ncbi:MAG: hypothetical protein ACI86C_001929 [Candidatus Latescibacterota bacterium]
MFFEEINDIDIYIEDTAFGYSKLFSILFSRVFEGRYKVGKVFPLGGREAVVSEHAASESDRPSVYIIDGDLFLLTGDTAVNKKGLYEFPYYCVENVLCDHESLLSVMDEEEPEKDHSKINELFDYQKWLENNEEKLFLLFVEYAISMILNPQEQTVAFKVSGLVSSNKGELDRIKLLKRIEELKSLSVNRSSLEEYQAAQSKIICEFEGSGLNKLDIVSGKEYILPLLKTRAKSIVKTKISDLNFKMRLARICNIERLASAMDYVAC